MAGLKIRGNVPDVTALPFSDNVVGDAYLLNGDMYVWDGSSWSNVGRPSGPVGASGMPGNYTKRTHLVDLTYRGLKVSIWSSEDIASLFLDPGDLQPDDLAIFDTTYPEDYEKFRDEWSKKRAIQVANDELEGWRKDYEKNERRDNP